MFLFFVFIATLHAGKPKPLSRRYETCRLVSACSTKLQRSEADIARGGKKKKSGEKPGKEPEVVISEEVSGR